MSCKLSQQRKRPVLVRNLTSACLVTVTLLTASVFAKDGRRGMQVIAEAKHDSRFPCGIWNQALRAKRPRRQGA